MRYLRLAWLWGPVVAYMTLIFIESAQPSVSLPGTLSDKQAHALGYAGLGALIARAAGGGFPGMLSPGAAMWSIVAAIGYGVSDEWHQSFVPGRTADTMDVVADAFGACVAVGLVWACGIIWPRLARRPGAIP